MHNVKTGELEKIWITADHHFGHENIIRFCNRPFETIQEMDQVLIDNWNKVVGSDDIVYHLGDFTLGGFDIARKYFKQLNGKIQVLGNHWHHDKRWLPKNYFGPLTLEYPDAIDVGHVNIIPPMIVLELEEMGNKGRSLGVTLCHYPLEVWDRKHYGAWHLYGHTHKHPKEIGPFKLNVGVDCQNFFPISLGGVLQYMYEMGW